MTFSLMGRSCPGTGENVAGRVWPGRHWTVRQRSQFAQDFHSLTGQWYNMLLTHLHALGRNAPFPLVEVELPPLCLTEFARPDKDRN